MVMPTEYRDKLYALILSRRPANCCSNPLGAQLRNDPIFRALDVVQKAMKLRIEAEEKAQNFAYQVSRQRKIINLFEGALPRTSRRAVSRKLLMESLNSNESLIRGTEFWRFPSSNELESELRVALALTQPIPLSILRVFARAILDFQASMELFTPRYYALHDSCKEARSLLNKELEEDKKAFDRRMEKLDENIASSQSRSDSLKRMLESIDASTAAPDDSSAPTFLDNLSFIKRWDVSFALIVCGYIGAIILQGNILRGLLISHLSYATQQAINAGYPFSLWLETQLGHSAITAFVISLAIFLANGMAFEAIAINIVASVLFSLGANYLERIYDSVIVCLE